MSAIKNSFVSLQVQRALSNKSIKRENVGYNKANHTAIIFKAGDSKKHNIIKKFVKKLENDGKKVEVLTYLEKGQENHEFLYDFFQEEDVSFWGLFRSECVNNFIEKKFDFLFHIDLEANKHIEHVLAKSKAKCRIGPYMDKKNGFYEMMVKSETNNFEEFINQIYHYTRSLI
jgi:hypothetical protein